MSKIKNILDKVINNNFSESYIPTDSDKSTFNVGITKSVMEHLRDYFNEYN